MGLVAYAACKAPRWALESGQERNYFGFLGEPRVGPVRSVVQHVACVDQPVHDPRFLVLEMVWEDWIAQSLECELGVLRFVELRHQLPDFVFDFLFGF